MDKTHPVIVYCRSGRRAGWALQKLQSLGFSNVVNARTGDVVIAAMQTLVQQQVQQATTTEQTEQKTLSLQEALHSQNVVVVDVRGVAESQFRVPGSLVIPYDYQTEGEAFTTAISEGALDTDNKQTPIVLYCRSGRRAGWAKERLAELGYSTVINGRTGPEVADAMQSVKEAQLHKVLQDPNVIIVDVRGVEETQHRVAGSLVVPYDYNTDGVEFTKAVENGAFDSQDKTQPIVLYCRSGRRAGWAQMKLLAMGYTTVINALTGDALAKAMKLV